MTEVLEKSISTLRGIWQRRWIGLGAAWLIGIIAAVVILKMPDKYEATARIYVDTQSVLKPLMSGLAVPLNVSQQIQMLSRTLISRTNVDKLIRMSDLDLGARTKEDQERMIDQLMGTLQIRGTGRDNLYTLSFRDQSPDKAKRVVQSLVSIFVESSLGGKRQDSDSAKRFLDEQIKGYETKLAEAEERLKEFKLRNIDLGNSEGRDYFGRVSEINTMLAQARLQLREAENSRDALKQQLTDEPPALSSDMPMAMPISEPVAMATEIDSRIDAHKRSLDQLRLKYTEEHPDVIGTKRVLADLEDQRRKELAAAAAARAKARGTDPARPAQQQNANPVYQQLKVSLGEAEANVAQLRTRVAEYDSRYAKLKASARLVPQIEAEHTQLNRDYEVHKKNYEGLVSRRESAELSGEMADSGVADFRLIDPPRVSPRPVAPNRLLLLVGAFLGALGAGIGAAFLASQLRPTFLDARSLSAITGLPVLGTVTMIVNKETRRRERRGIFGFTAAALAFVGSFAAGIVALFLITSRAV